MENIILFVHLLVALAIIGLILLQQGKGAEMGASFGAGASQTLFGAAGTGNFFSKMTAILATVFFVTSFSLAVISKQKTEIDDDIPIPTLEIESPKIDSDVPELGGSIQQADDASDVPSVSVKAESAESNESGESKPVSDAEPASASEDTPK